MTADRRLSIVSVVNAVGGSGLSGLELSAALARHGHLVHVVTYAQTEIPQRWRESGMQVLPVDPVFIGSLPHPAVVLSMVAAVVDLGRRQPIDIIHAHYAVTHGEVAILSRDAIIAGDVGSHDRRPVAVITCRGTDISRFAADPRCALGLRHVLGSADAVSYVSSDLRDRAVELLGIGVQGPVIPNFVPDLAAPETDWSAASMMPTAECVFVHASTFRPIKNVAWIIEAFAAASRALPEGAVRLALIGDGPTVEQARLTAKRESVAHLVTFTGKVPPGQVRPLVRRADVALMASDVEGCPRAVLEAMIEGKPVVATDVAGLNRLVLDGETGLLAAAGDIGGYAAMLRRLAQDPPLRARLGRQARTRVGAVFSEEAVLHDYEDMFTAAMSPTIRIAAESARTAGR